MSTFPPGRYSGGPLDGRPVGGTPFLRGGYAPYRDVTGTDLPSATADGHYVHDLGSGGHCYVYVEAADEEPSGDRLGDRPES